VKKLTKPVILSEAKDLSSFIFKQLQGSFAAFGGSG